MAESDLSTLGSDLMSFFGEGNSPRNQRGNIQPRKLGDFLGNPNRIAPGVVWAAAEKLAEHGLLISTGSQPGLPALNATYLAVGKAAGAPDVYDYLVGGFSEIRRRLGEAVLHLAVTHPNGDADSGTGFLIGESLMLTARHCVENVEFEIQNPRDPGRSLTKAGEPWSQSADFATVPITGGHGLPSFSLGSPQLLGQVMAMGYPKLEGLYPTLVTSTGEVAGMASAYLDRHSYWLTTCALTGGSSGGPVVNERGQVVGVVSALPADRSANRVAPFGLMVSPDEGFTSLAADGGNLP